VFVANLHISQYQTDRNVDVNQRLPRRSMFNGNTVDTTLSLDLPMGFNKCLHYLVVWGALPIVKVVIRHALLGGEDLAT
jgi:hypothetical protein